MSEELNKEQQEAVKIVQEQINQSLDADFIEDVVKNNACEFDYKDVRYKVVKPSYQQKQEIYKERVKKFTALLKDKEYSLEKDLKQIYLSRGIDIDAMTKKIQNLETKKIDLQIKLGELLKKDASDTDCGILKKEIEDITQEQRAIAYEKQNLLEFSIENQMVLHIYNYMTYIVTEKKVNDKWVKAFVTFDEFMNSEEDLVTKLAFLITMTTRDIV